MTEKKRPAQQRSFEARWKAVLDAAVEGIVVIDRSGTMESCNAAVTRMFQYSPEELIGHNVSMLMPDSYRREHDGYLQRYLESGEAHIIGVGREVDAVRKDGSVFPIHLSVGEFRNEAGEPGFVGVLHDITEKRAALDRVEERERLLRRTFQEAPLASATVSPDGSIESANQRFRELFGLEDPCAGYDFRKLLHPADRRLVFPIEGPLCLPESDSRHQGVRFRTADGRQLEGVLHSSIVFDRRRNPVLCVVQVEDHTEQMRAERELALHRQRLAHVSRLTTVGEMASGIAHEVNQPLSAIANYSNALLHLLSAGAIEDAELRETLAKIAGQAQRAGDVIRRIRGFIGQGKTETRIGSINEVIDEVVVLSETDAKYYGLDVTVELDDAVPPVVHDAVQIQQVLLNLLRNAMEATSVGPRPHDPVTIRTLTGPERDVRIAVVDHGTGVPAKDQAQLFSTFFSTKPSGTGLGLAISRSIIENHKGRLWFENNEHGGATFWVRLPAAPESAA